MKMYQRILNLLQHLRHPLALYNKKIETPTLSSECMANKGLCCENRTPPVLLPAEIHDLLQDKIISDEFIFGKVSAKAKGVCTFFKEPFCTVYETRPIDCRTYPISIDLKNETLVFVIDTACPAVRKGLVTDEFIQQAIKTWRNAELSKEWIKEYLEHDNLLNYAWISISEYEKHRKLVL